MSFPLSQFKEDWEKSLALTTENVTRKASISDLFALQRVYKVLEDHRRNLEELFDALHIPLPQEEGVQNLGSALNRYEQLKDRHNLLLERSPLLHTHVVRVLTHDSAKEFVKQIVENKWNAQKSNLHFDSPDQELSLRSHFMYRMERQEVSRVTKMDAQCEQIVCRDALVQVLKPVISTASHELLTNYVSNGKGEGAFGFAQTIYTRMPFKQADIIEAHNMLSDDSEDTRKLFVEELLKNVRVEK